MVKFYIKYKGKWVALQKDEATVVGFGKSAKDAFEMAVKKGIQNPVLAKVPKRILTYVGTL